MKKLIAVLMTIILTVSLAPGSVAKAEVFTYKGGAAESEAVKTLKPNLCMTEKDTEKDEGTYEIVFPDDEEILIMPVEIRDKGGLYCTITEQNTNYYSISADLYKDKACSERIGYSIYLSSGEMSETRDIPVGEAGTYYLKLEAIKKRDTGTISFLLQLTLFSGEDQELKKDKAILSYQDYEGPDVTYKIVVNTSGILTLNFGTDYEYGFYGKIQLLDKDKKGLAKAKSIFAPQNEEGEYLDAEKFYAVNKGTYYVKVDTSVGLYNIKYSFSEVKDPAGAKRDKAKALKLGDSAVKGICTVTDKTTDVDWYSFKLTSSKSVTITISAKTDENLKYDILDSKGNSLYYGSRIIWDGEGNVVLKSDGKLSKGTYYIKIFKYDKTSSGYYTIKVK